MTAADLMRLAVQLSDVVALHAEAGRIDEPTQRVLDTELGAVFQTLLGGFEEGSDD